MTQSKPKPKMDQKSASPFGRIYKFLDKCSDEELKRLAEEIDQLLWERDKVSEAMANPSPSIPSEQVFEQMFERHAAFVDN